MSDVASRAAQKEVTARYDRIARFYDLVDKPMDLLGVSRRRRRLLSKASGATLEVGVGWVADRLAPLVSRAFGPDINRRTEDNVTEAGLDIIEVQRWGVWREIVARPHAKPEPT